MGLFDRVIYETRCTRCGEKLTEFQTKNTSNPALVSVSLDYVNSFYTECFCGATTYFTRLSEFERKIHGTDFRRVVSFPAERRKRHGFAQSSEA